MIDKNQSSVDSDNYDFITHICDVFDAYLLREEFGSEYILKESDAFRRKIIKIFNEEDEVL